MAAEWVVLTFVTSDNGYVSGCLHSLNHYLSSSCMLLQSSPVEDAQVPSMSDSVNILQVKLAFNSVNLKEGFN